MAELGRLLSLRLLLRSFLIQGSWNYRTMQGAGLAFALIPALAWMRRGDPDGLARALGRHTGFFNANPYLATVAVSAVARMEADGATPEEVERFKRALVSPLGSLGDRLTWARWRPLTALLAVLTFVAGAPWWVAAALFLLLYNAVQLALRVWGLRLGWQEGREVGRALMASRLRRLPDRLTVPLALVCGALLPPLALAVGGASGVGSIQVIGIAFVLSAAGYWRPAVAGRLAALGLLLASLAIVGLETTVW
jgi:mannose/fructose/N-acetylgalactosamine-specific phosphotransferase system component IID